jgi:hypothetical protein
MSVTEPDQARAGAAKGFIDRLGGGFMRSREVAAAAEDGGYRGWQMYFAGRAGVLGDVDADVVSASVTFFPADFVRRAWTGSRDIEPRPASVARYAGAAHAWGRRLLGGWEASGRLAELLGGVVEQMPVPGAPLAAGWRAVPLPADAPARVVQLAHILREHRGAMHAVAVLAAGMTPLQAILSGPGGPEGARYFGWPAPYPDVDSTVRAARARVEAHTDQLEAPTWAVLEGAAAAECLRLLEAAAGRTAG